MANATVYQLDNTAPGLLGRARKALTDYRLYRSTIAELEALNNRELRDLGLSRFSIRQVAYDSVYGL